eukprot:1565175-Amphidinium_carterae.1
MLRCEDCSRVLNSLWHGSKSEGVASVQGGWPPLTFGETSPTCATRTGDEATQSHRIRVCFFSEEATFMACVCEPANSESVPCHVVALPDVLPRVLGSSESQFRKKSSSRKSS